MKRILLFVLALTVLFPWYINAQTFPELSQNGSDKWYSIHSHRAGKVLKNNGTEEVITSVDFEDIDILRWKFESTGAFNEDQPVFKIISKAGGALSYGKFVEDPEGNYLYNEDTGEYIKLPDGAVGTHARLDRWYIRTVEEGNTFIFKQYLDDDGYIFQLFCLEEESYINMTNNTDDHQICLYNVENDSGNSFSAYVNIEDFYAKMYAGAPEFSTADAPKWYYMKSCRTGRVFAYDGDPQNLLKQVSLIVTPGSLEQESQLFRFEGDYNGFRVISKIENYELNYNSGSDRIIFADPGQGATFTFSKYPDKENQFGKDKWELKYAQNGKCINETSNEACLYNAEDTGNAIHFIRDNQVNDLFKDAPDLSSQASPLWYYIRNLRSEKVLASLGIADGRTWQRELTKSEEPIDSLNAQLFRFEGTYDEFKIISRNNTELKYDASGNRIVVVAVGEGDKFKFSPSTVNTYGEGKWTIIHISNGNAINTHNTKVDEIVLYSASDPGSIFEFIASELNPSSLKNDNLVKARPIISGRNMEITGENIAHTATYSITGITIPQISENQYTLPAAGCYIVKIHYNDGTSENIKVAIK